VVRSSFIQELGTADRVLLTPSGVRRVLPGREGGRGPAGPWKSSRSRALVAGVGLDERRALEPLMARVGRGFEAWSEKALEGKNPGEYRPSARGNPSRSRTDS
jgi:hypothetical protein